MISISEALAILADNLTTLSPENVPLEQSGGRFLAERILAREPSPAFTNSAMDGYALRSEDVAAAADRPVKLALVGESAAGAPFSAAIKAGEAMRINTGAVLCEGADAVVPQEAVTVADEFLMVSAPVAAGAHLRRCGEEFESGAALLEEGCRLDARHQALLAAQGVIEVPVLRRPKAALILTGRELVHHRETPANGQIRDANGPMLEGLLGENGALRLPRIRVGDNPGETVAAIRTAAQLTDLIICSGGVSVGPHDHVKEAAAQVGFETLFWRVRQRPGKPLFLARRGPQLLFGLPGNPVSAYMCFLFYIAPALRAMQGGEFSRQSHPAVLSEAVENKLSRDQLFRVVLEGSPEGWLATPLAKQGSHMLTSLTGADGFFWLKAGALHPAGSRVEVLQF